MSLVHAAYVSRVARPMDIDEIRRIIAVSDRNNRRAEITGALVHDGGLFAQVLEGPAAPLKETLERIRRDERHTEMRIVTYGPLAERAFRRWTMGAYDLQAGDPSHAAVQSMRARLVEYVEGGAENAHAHLPAYFRYCMALLESHEVPEEIVVEPPSYLRAG